MRIPGKFYPLIFSCYLIGLFSRVSYAADIPVTPHDLLPEQKIEVVGKDLPQWKTVWDKARKNALQGNFDDALHYYQALLVMKSNLAEARWEMVRHVKSNAIVICKDRMLLGAGAGQMSRVDSTEIAIKKAGDRIGDSVLASDAFFPFPDSIELIAEAGVRAIIEPGGSKKDDEVIAACNQHGIAMVFTGRRHFRH